MANAEDIERDLATAVTLYQSAPTAENALSLLTLMHEIGEHTAEQVEAYGLPVASLRPHFPAPDPNAPTDGSLE